MASRIITKKNGGYISPNLFSHCDCILILNLVTISFYTCFLLFSSCSANHVISYRIIHFTNQCPLCVEAWPCVRSIAHSFTLTVTNTFYTIYGVT